MKKNYLVYTAAAICFIALIMQYQPASSNVAGAPSATTGSPHAPGSGATCAQSGCHNSYPVTNLPNIITTNVPVAGYTPGATYQVTMTVSSPTDSVFGFEISPQDASGNILGTITPSPLMQIASAGYLTHTSGSVNAPSHTRIWTFNWKAPVTGLGPVTFYGAFAYCDGDGFATNDSIHTSTLTLTEVVPIAHVSVNITNGANPGCLGLPISFTATPTNGGSTPVYDWQVNGNTVSHLNPFTISTLQNGDSVRCIMTSSLNPVLHSPDTSSYTIMSLGPQGAIPLVTITAADTTICVGASDTFHAIPTNGGSSPTYQWMVNRINVGNHLATFITNTLQNNDTVSCVMTSSQACVGAPTATSNSIVIQTGIAITPTVKIGQGATAHNPICQGDTIHFMASVTNSGSTPSYQWRINGNAVGQNKDGFDTTGVNNGDIVTCDLTSSAPCATPATVGSNSIPVSITAIVHPTISISPDKIKICSGNDVTFSASATGTGASPGYTWVLNGNVVALNILTYKFNATITGLTVWCVLTSSAPCAIPASDTSNHYSIGITKGPPVTIIPAGAVTICGNDSVLLTASGGLHYFWNTGDTTASIWVKQSGNFGAYASDNSGCKGDLALDTVYTSGFPPIPQIGIHSDTIAASNTTGGTWQWYRNDSILTGETNATIIATIKGTYHVVFTDPGGCRSKSPDIAYHTSGIMAIDAGNLQVFPNPNTGAFTIERMNADMAEIAIYNIYGQRIHTQAIYHNRERVTIPDVNKGLYYLVITQDGSTISTKIEIQ